MRRRAGGNARNAADREPSAVGELAPGPVAALIEQRRCASAMCARCAPARDRRRASARGSSGISRWRRKLREKRTSAIARVLDPAQLRGARGGFDLAARHVQQRTRDVPGPERRDTRHGGEAGDTCPAEQLQQQCLDLVVAMLCRHQHLAGLQGLREQGVTRVRARRPREIRRVCVRCSRAETTNGRRQAARNAGAMPAHSALAACRPMIDMHQPQARRACGADATRCVASTGGIDAAAECHDHARPRTGELDQLRDGIDAIDRIRRRVLNGVCPPSWPTSLKTPKLLMR